MQIDEALDAVFFQPVPNTVFITPGPTFRPITPDKFGDPISWQCYPPILGQANLRKGLPGLRDQISLLCPSTAYVLLPSGSISDMNGEDLDPIVDVSEVLRYVHEGLGIDMYVVLVFGEVEPEVCQSYAHIFEADIALTGCVGNLIYESILLDMKLNTANTAPSADHRLQSLASCSSRTPLPISRYRILPLRGPEPLFSSDSPLKVVWRGSIFSQANNEYSGFRFLHNSALGMPVGRVTMKSCYPSSLSASTSTNVQPAFLVTLDITASTMAIDLVESWRECNAHVTLDFDGATFVASWAPPSEKLNYWHIMAVSVETVSTQVENAHISGSRRCYRSLDKESDRPSVLPPDVMALPVFSYRDVISAPAINQRDSMNNRGIGLKPRRYSSQARNLSHTRSLKREMDSRINPMRRLVRRRRDGFQLKSLDHIPSPSKGLKNVNYVHLNPNVSKNSRYRKLPNPFPGQGSKSLVSQCSSTKEASKTKVKSFSGRQVSAKIDHQLVIIAMRQSFDSSPLCCTVRRPMAKGKHDPTSRSWSKMGLVASGCDGSDTVESPSTEENSLILHGVEYQCCDATAEVEAAIYTAGVEFMRYSPTTVKLSRVLHSLLDLKHSLPFSGDEVSVL